eukprot:PhF_6_TR35362/c0_g1_i3/m.51342
MSMLLNADPEKVLLVMTQQIPSNHPEALARKWFAEITAQIPWLVYSENSVSDSSLSCTILSTVLLTIAQECQQRHDSMIWTSVLNECLVVNGKGACASVHAVLDVLSLAITYVHSASYLLAQQKLSTACSNVMKQLVTRYSRIIHSVDVIDVMVLIQRGCGLPEGMTWNQPLRAAWYMFSTVVRSLPLLVSPSAWRDIVCLGAVCMAKYAMSRPFECVHPITSWDEMERFEILDFTTNDYVSMETRYRHMLNSVLVEEGYLNVVYQSVTLDSTEYMMNNDTRRTSSLGSHFTNGGVFPVGPLTDLRTQLIVSRGGTVSYIERNSMKREGASSIESSISEQYPTLPVVLVQLLAKVVSPTPHIQSLGYNVLEFDLIHAVSLKSVTPQLLLDGYYQINFTLTHPVLSPAWHFIQSVVLDRLWWATAPAIPEAMHDTYATDFLSLMVVRVEAVLAYHSSICNEYHQRVLAGVSRLVEVMISHPQHREFVASTFGVFDPVLISCFWFTTQFILTSGGGSFDDVISAYRQGMRSLGYDDLYILSRVMITVPSDRRKDTTTCVVHVRELYPTVHYQFATLWGAALGSCCEEMM